MTIDRLTIRNFQSLQDVTLDLAPLTVIVGPSSSGKSAFIRSLRALVANRRGTDFITHGEHTSSISAHIASNDPLRSGTVTLTRSTRTAPNSYTLIPDDAHHPLHPKAEFTKLGGDVPAPISDFLGITPEHVPLAVASQFDKPYLLDAPATEVARTFASLTNAHIILNGARESNRQKLSASQTLRTRSDDLEAIRARVPEFKALATQRSALDRAEALLTDAYALQGRLDALRTLTETQEIAAQRIPALRTQLASIPEPRDIEEAISAHQDAQKRLSTYREALQAVSGAQRAAQSRREALASAASEHDQAVADARDAMRGIADGFVSYFRENASRIDLLDEGTRETIDIREAAALAARYVAQLDS